METKKQTGFYWHCHHDLLLEYVYDYQERVDYIKKEKPVNERKTRLKLFKKVKSKLPKDIVEAGKKYDEAWKKYDEALKKYNEAWEKYYEVSKKYYEVREKCDELIKKHKDFLEKLHKKECGCKEWNGKEIVFKD